MFTDPSVRRKSGAPAGETSAAKRPALTLNHAVGPQQVSRPVDGILGELDGLDTVCGPSDSKPPPGCPENLAEAFARRDPREFIQALGAFGIIDIVRHLEQMKAQGHLPSREQLFVLLAEVRVPARLWKQYLRLIELVTPLALLALTEHEKTREKLDPDAPDPKVVQYACGRVARHFDSMPAWQVAQWLPATSAVRKRMHWAAPLYKHACTADALATLHYTLVMCSRLKNPAVREDILHSIALGIAFNGRGPRPPHEIDPGRLQQTLALMPSSPAANAVYRQLMTLTGWPAPGGLFTHPSRNLHDVLEMARIFVQVCSASDRSYPTEASKAFFDRRQAVADNPSRYLPGQAAEMRSLGYQVDDANAALADADGTDAQPCRFWELQRGGTRVAFISRISVSFAQPLVDELMFSLRHQKHEDCLTFHLNPVEKKKFAMLATLAERHDLVEWKNVPGMISFIRAEDIGSFGQKPRRELPPGGDADASAWR